jgi:hypothetical protein
MNAAAFSYSKRRGLMCVTRRATRVSHQRLTGEILAIGYQGWSEAQEDRAKSGHILRMWE